MMIRQLRSHRDIRHRCTQAVQKGKQLQQRVDALETAAAEATSRVAQVPDLERRVADCQVCGPDIWKAGRPLHHAALHDVMCARAKYHVGCSCTSRMPSMLMGPEDQSAPDTLGGCFKK